MNSLKFLRTCRRFVSSYYFPKTKLADSKSKLPLIKSLFPTCLLFGPVFMPNTAKNQKKDVPTNYIKQIKNNCIGSEKKIGELILTLKGAITETCGKYRSCLKKQIDIMEGGLKVDPLDQYWDSLVPLRVEADNLKRDFESYRSMIEYVGQLAFNLAFCSALINNLDSKDYVCDEYFKLEKIAKEQVAENKKMEEILLEKNMQNILNTPNTAKDTQEVESDLKRNMKNFSEDREKVIRNKIIS